MNNELSTPIVDHNLLRSDSPTCKCRIMYTDKCAHRENGGFLWIGFECEWFYRWAGRLSREFEKIERCRQMTCWMKFVKAGHSCIFFICYYYFNPIDLSKYLSTLHPFSTSNLNRKCLSNTLLRVEVFNWIKTCSILYILTSSSEWYIYNFF